MFDNFTDLDSIDTYVDIDSSKLAPINGFSSMQNSGAAIYPATIVAGENNNSGFWQDNLGEANHNYNPVYLAPPVQLSGLTIKPAAYQADDFYLATSSASLPTNPVIITEVNKNESHTETSTKTNLFFFALALLAIAVVIVAITILNNHNQQKKYIINENCISQCSATFENHEDNSQNIPINLQISKQ